MTAMIEERRENERVKVELPARWEGVLEGRDGTVTDLSPTGCFILTAGDVKPKELVRLEIELETGRRILLWGEVVYRTQDIGFAVRFTGTEETEQKMLEVLIEYVRARAEAEA